MSHKGGSGKLPIVPSRKKVIVPRDRFAALLRGVARAEAVETED
jgi:hypothetical protein